MSAPRLVTEVRIRRPRKAVSKVTICRWTGMMQLLHAPSGYMCDHCLETLKVGELVVAVRNESKNIKAIMHVPCFNELKEKSS